MGSEGRYRHSPGLAFCWLGTRVRHGVPRAYGALTCGPPLVFLRARRFGAAAGGFRRAAGETSGALTITAYAPGMVVDSPALSAVETQRLRLRCAELRDAGAIAAMMTETISRRLASWPMPYTPLMALDRIAGVRMAAAQRRSVPLVIERRADGAVMGWISISRAPGDEGTALLTYWLGEEFQGHAYMREAAPAALAAAFAWMKDVVRVRAAVQGDNASSLYVVNLLGMTPLGEGRIWCPARGREEACLWFELLRPARLVRQRAADAAD